MVIDNVYAFECMCICSWRQEDNFGYHSYGGLNKNGSYCLICLNTWKIYLGRIRRCGLLGGGVSTGAGFEKITRAIPVSLSASCLCI